MPAFNQLILMGNMTNDPQLSYTPNQTAIVDFGLAVSRKWKQDGEAREDALFVDVRAYGKKAEILNKYTKKGSCIHVIGYLVLEKWNDREGGKHSKHRMIAYSVQFIGRNGKPGREPGGSEPPSGGDIPF